MIVNLYMLNVHNIQPRLYNMLQYLIDYIYYKLWNSK